VVTRRLAEGFGLQIAHVALESLQALDEFARVDRLRRGRGLRRRRACFGKKSGYRDQSCAGFHPPSACRFHRIASSLQEKTDSLTLSQNLVELGLNGSRKDAGSDTRNSDVRSCYDNA
jgi:hypothetical protein